MTDVELRQNERLHGVAEQVALRTGLLRRCPIHGDPFDSGQHDYQGACMMAAFLVNQADPLVSDFGGNRGALTGLLKSISDRYALACPRCAPDATT